LIEGNNAPSATFPPVQNLTMATRLVSYKANANAEKHREAVESAGTTQLTVLIRSARGIADVFVNPKTQKHADGLYFIASSSILSSGTCERP